MRQDVRRSSLLERASEHGKDMYIGGYLFCMEDKYKGFLAICEYLVNLLNNNT